MPPGLMDLFGLYRGESPVERVVFDLSAGKAAKVEGIARASTGGPRQALLAKVRAHVRELSRRENRCVNADDVSRYLLSIGLSESELGPATGGVFRGHEWEFTGEYVTSTKVANHARMLKQWRFIETTSGETE